MQALGQTLMHALQPMQSIGSLRLMTMEVSSEKPSPSSQSSSFEASPKSRSSRSTRSNTSRGQVLKHRPQPMHLVWSKVMMNSGVYSTPPRVMPVILLMSFSLIFPLFLTAILLDGFQRRVGICPCLARVIGILRDLGQFLECARQTVFHQV